MPSVSCGVRSSRGTPGCCTRSRGSRKAWRSSSSCGPTCSSTRDARGALGLLDDELTGHLSTLFDVGLLHLRQITWDSPAAVLERLMETEAVHDIADWDDLRHRLDGDQRCYGFFHPALEHEPIVFVEVALDPRPGRQPPQLLDRDDAVDDPDTAIFYSITSAQSGLPGVHLGNELIKQVVDALRRENDHLKTFATLSPLPGFRRWLADQVDADALTPAELESLGARRARRGRARGFVVGR